MIDKKHFQEKLSVEKNLLEEELSQIAILNHETNTWEATPNQEMVGEADDNDAADRFEDFEERTSMVNTLQSRLNDINLALDKITDDRYGMCESGNDHPIESDRLEANPAARTCKVHMNEM